MHKVLKKVEKGNDEGTAPERTRIEVKEIQMLFEDEEFFELKIIEESLNDQNSCKILQGYTQDLFRPPMA